MAIHSDGKITFGIWRLRAVEILKLRWKILIQTLHKISPPYFVCFFMCYRHKTSSPFQCIFKLFVGIPIFATQPYLKLSLLFNYNSFNLEVPNFIFLLHALLIRLPSVTHTLRFHRHDFPKHFPLFFSVFTLFLQLFLGSFNPYLLLTLIAIIFTHMIMKTWASM